MMAALNDVAIFVVLPLAVVSLLAAVCRWWTRLARALLSLVIPPMLLLYLATNPTVTRADLVVSFAAGLAFLDAGLRVSEALAARREELDQLERQLRGFGGAR